MTRLYALRILDPARVFLPVGVRERVEEGSRVRIERRSEILGHLDRPFLIVENELDRHPVTRRDTGSRPNLLVQADQVPLVQAIRYRPDMAPTVVWNS